MPPRYRRPSRTTCSILLGLALWTGSGWIHGQHTLVDVSKFDLPVAKPGVEEAKQALRRMSLPPGWTGSVWAAEPDLAQPVAFDIADDGRVFVAESLRARRGVQDIRPLPDWLDEDLAARTVEDRLAMMRRHLGEEGLKPFLRNSERIRLLADSTGAGRADSSKVFAEGFSTALDGVASSVLARGNEVWFANIPDVWWLRDANGDGKADERRSLSHGHGVRISMLGHDLHGLAWGPDGRIYVSVGDRGSRVFHDGRWIGNPECGAVFRFEPDGSGFEMFAQGLRNPQELVFDDFGNLFSGDNSANSGDESRWVNVVEGGDSGWRIGWQWAENRLYDGSGWRGGADGPGAVAPWITESMWLPQTNGQPAYIVPPVANISAGPCGAALYPGTGLGPDWDGTFVLADFRGSSSGSGFWKFQVRPKGARFELVNPTKFIWGVNATDGCWGPDGAFWLLDWTDGWEPEGRGRIYRFADPAQAGSASVRETASLLKAGFAQRSVEDLLNLLGHRNRRVRQGAQAELVARWMKDRTETNRAMGHGPTIVSGLANLAAGGPTLLGRLHAIWAIGHGLRIAGKQDGLPEEASLANRLVRLLDDPEREVRIQSARILGDLRVASAEGALVRALNDPDLQVRAAAATALGKLGRNGSFPALVEMLRANADGDAVLRHAGVLGLLGCGDAERILALATDPSESVRIAAVVALRRLERNELERFLGDPSPRVATEAARAIHDLPVTGALPGLAARIRRPMTDWALARRAINANLRTGTAEAARDLARLAADDAAPSTHRTAALEALSAWPGTSGRDRITGLWRPLPFTRDPGHARDAVRAAWNALAGAADTAVLAGLMHAADALDLRETAPRLAAFATDSARTSEVRLGALAALGRWEPPLLAGVLDRLLDDADGKIRAEALGLATRSGGDGAVARLARVLKSGGLRDRQAAVAALGRLPDPGATARLVELGDDLLAGRLDPSLEADVLEAAAAHTNGPLAALPGRFAAALPKDDPLAPFRWALKGGDFDAGQAVYRQKAGVECVRCHKMYGTGGEVGPDLTAVGTRRDARYLLESVVHPNAAIATGFETALLTLKNGDSHAGIVKSETAGALELRAFDGTILKLAKAEIASRDRGVSGMPEGFAEILTRRELRDLVAYLSGLK
jgi:quinoprotein glucose dehydrogenase